MKQILHKKPCRDCDEMKELRDYWKSKTCKDGHENICKKCKNIRRRKAQGKDIFIPLTEEEKKIRLKKYQQSEQGKKVRKRYMEKAKEKAKAKAKEKKKQRIELMIEKEQMRFKEYIDFKHNSIKQFCDDYELCASRVGIWYRNNYEVKQLSENTLKIIFKVKNPIIVKRKHFTTIEQIEYNRILHKKRYGNYGKRCDITVKPKNHNKPKKKKYIKKCDRSLNTQEHIKNWLKDKNCPLRFENQMKPVFSSRWSRA